jgi:hypothetical protein
MAAMASASVMRTTWAQLMPAGPKPGKATIFGEVQVIPRSVESMYHITFCRALPFEM